MKEGGKEGGKEGRKESMNKNRKEDGVMGMGKEDGGGGKGGMGTR